MTRRSLTRAKVFRVGVTGHRLNRLPQQHHDRIRRQLSQSMARIEKTTGGQTALLSGLAEGADRLAAFVALGRAWSLHAILAFHRSRFEEDFADTYSVGEFRALLAASTEVDEPNAKWHRGKTAEDGYDAVGNKLVERCDLIIAVWDGEASRGRGGTVEVIEQARANGVAVVWIHASSSQSPRRLVPVETSTARAAKATAANAVR